MNFSKKYIKYAGIVYLLAQILFFFNSPYYFKQLKSNVYITNRMFEKKIYTTDFLNKNILCRDPWIAYKTKANWNDILIFDKKFAKKIRKLDIDYIILGERYAYFFDHSLYFKKKTPDYLQLEFKENINGINCIVYKVNKKRLINADL